MYNELTHLKGLRYVEAAARHLSYSKAAQELNVSQAAVSQQIRQIENHLGLKLFYRKGHEMKLTPQGKILAESLRSGLEAMVEGIGKIQTESIEGTLTVTTTQSFASMFLIPRLWSFTQENPQIGIRLVSSPEIEEIKHANIDVAIRYGAYEQEALKQFLLFEEPDVPLCSPNLARNMKLKDPSELLECWLIEYAYQNTWQRWFDKAGYRFNKRDAKIIEVTNMDNALSAVMSGGGVCIGSAIQASYYLENGLLEKPFDIGLEPGTRYGVLYDENSPRIRRIEAFTNWLIAETRKFKKSKNKLD